MINRRSFIAGILACATPPGFVRSGILMPVQPKIALLTDDHTMDAFRYYGGGRAGGKSDLAPIFQVAILKLKKEIEEGIYQNKGLFAQPQGLQGLIK